MKNYLIISNYFRLINEKIDELINHDNETIKYDLNIHNIKDIITDASYNSLFDQGKNIIVFNCNIFSNAKITEEEQKVLLEYFTNPNPDNVIIFISNENEDSRKKITKLLKENNAIYNYNNLKYNDLNSYLMNFIKKNNYNINGDVINYVLKCANLNYDIACSEIEKICLAYGDKPTIDDAKSIISSNISENIFKFIDEIINCNHKKAKELLDDLKILKVDPASVISLMFREYRHIFLYRLALEYNISVNDMFKTEYLKDWQLNKIATNSQKISTLKAKKIISLLANYDYLYKSGKIEKDLVLDTLLFEILI